MIAEVQHGRVSRSQLRAAGIGAASIDRRVAQGYLVREHRGVYAVGHLAPMPWRREAAALLAVRDGAVLSHLSAALLWGLLPAGADDGLVHLMLQGSSPARRQGVRAHRTRVLDASDICIRNRLPVSSPARTLLDIATLVTARQFELAFDQGIVAKLVRPAEIARLLDRSVRHPGRLGLTDLLQRQTGPTLTRSMAEERFLALVRGAQLPEPAVNSRVHGYEVDFYWHLQRLAVEVDGFSFHSTRRAFEHDRRKDAKLGASGVATMRVTWRQIENEGFAVVARLAQALVFRRS